MLIEGIRNWFFFRGEEYRITILGSARFSEQHPDAQKAYELGYRLAQKGAVILTGGGYGIMEAVSRGVKASNGISVGCYVKNIEPTNAYLTQTLSFNSLMSRQNAIMQYSKALVVFPGGFGTLAELLNALVLIQNKQINIPLFLIKSSFWEPLIQYFKETLLNDHQTIDAQDLNSIIITDSIEDVLERLG